MKYLISNTCAFFFILLLVNILHSCKKNDSTSQADLVLSLSDVDIFPDSTANIVIQSGNGNYTATTSNDSIVSVAISESTVKITATSNYANADAVVVITDKYYNRALINVHVKSKNELLLNKDSISILNQQGIDSLSIQNGRAPFKISLSDSLIAKAYIINNTVFVRGKKNGETALHIEDAGGKTSSLNIKINGSPYALDFGTSYFGYVNFKDIAIIDKSVTECKQVTFEITCKMSGYRGLQTFMGLENNLIFRGANDDYKPTHPIAIAGMHDSIMLESASSFPLNEWLNIALVVDCNQQEIKDKYKLYINGVKDSLIIDRQTGSHASVNLASSGDGNRFEVGRAAGQDFRALRGAVAEARVWTVARTEQQIKDNLCMLTEQSPQGLLARWTFSAGVDTYYIQDVSGGKYETNLIMSDINNGGNYNVVKVPANAFVERGCPSVQ